MYKILPRTLIASLTVGSAAVTPLDCQAQMRSKSGELVVIEPRSLPEQARLGGNSFVLHSDNAGSTCRYLEQQPGARLTVFKATDPSRIELVSTLSGDQRRE